MVSSWVIIKLSKKFGIKNSLLVLPPYDKKIHKKQKISLNFKKKYQNEVVFVGTWSIEKGKFLKEELEVKIVFYEEKPISIELPNQITCKIESTDVALKGQTVSSSYKPAILDNGAKIQVPPFIESGDEIIIDTRSIEYIKKI